MLELIEVKQKIRSIINEFEEYNSSCLLVFINDNTTNIEAHSGYLASDEEEDIDLIFKDICKNYKFYNNPSTFVGDIVLNKLSDYKNKKKFVYSTAQIGRDVNRRSFIPNFSAIHNIFSLTGDGYSLGLLQNKFHYYEISKNYVNVPYTFVYDGKKWTDSEAFDYDVVLKPNFECAAQGVTLVKSGDNIQNEAEDLYSKFKQPILIQQFIKGVEVEVPLIVSKDDYLALMPIEILKDDENKEILDEELVNGDKYDFKLHDGPSATKLREYTQKIAAILQCEGICRFDFIVDEEDEFWLFDIAAIPLISKHSSCRKSFELLFPEEKNNLFKTLIGIELQNQLDQ